MQFSKKARESLTFVEAWKVANCSKELAVIDRNLPKCLQCSYFFRIFPGLQIHLVHVTRNFSQLSSCLSQLTETPVNTFQVGLYNWLKNASEQITFLQTFLDHLDLDLDLLEAF